MKLLQSACAPWFVLSLSAATLGGPDPTAYEIGLRAEKADIEGSASLRSYSLVRHYVVDNRRFNKHAEMTVRISYQPGKGKSFQILSSSGAEGVHKRVFEKIIEAESESSDGQRLNDIRVGPRNYNFAFVGTEAREGHSCYVLELRPKRKSKYLLEGKVWIDKSDYGVVHVEGRPSERFSFWVGKPEIKQSFQRVGPVYMMFRNASVADVKILGRSELTISTTDFQVEEADARAASKSSAVD